MNKLRFREVCDLLYSHSSESGRAQVTIFPSAYDLKDGKETTLKEPWLNFCYKGSYWFIRFIYIECLLCDRHYTRFWD